MRTEEDTIALVHRLAVHYPDAVIAGILDRQGRRTARGLRFEGNRVNSLRTHWNIPCFVPKADAAEGELVTIKRAAIALGVATSTVHRLLNDGIIAGEQITPGAPWRIRLTEDLKTRLNGEAATASCPCARRSARSVSRGKVGRLNRDALARRRVASLYGRHRSRRASSRSLATRSNISPMDLIR